MAIKVTAFFLLLMLRGVRQDSLSTCSKDHKCPNSQTCCGNVCVDGLKVCKIECQKQADCDSLAGSQVCVDGFCECLPSSPCFNRSMLYDDHSCAADFDCSERAKCRNRTCVVTKGKLEELPLNPALLAIVTIIGVLMFSCLFCCCLSRMKSERHSMKTRVAKGKLKKVHHISEDAENAAKSASFPLVNAESQVSSAKVGKNSMELDQEDEALISIVTGGPALPPIREEDEADVEADKD